MENIIIATIKEWNIQNYFKLKETYNKQYNFHLITNQEELSLENIDKIKPKYIFFPHWSWIIDKNIYTKYNAIVFHMTDLPYGRGGSPLQNLIINKIYQTKISAIKVDDGLDTGDIYIKKDLDISTGSAQDIFIKTSNIIFEEMIPEFLKQNLKATPQKGEIVTFKRREKEQSDITTLNNPSILDIYDFIRMLDAKGYPKAYLELDNIKIEFFDVEKSTNKLSGKFEVINNE